MIWYHLLKDFAGPAVTLIASGAALFFTYRFNQAQKRIAESQRDIASNKLKLELFERKYLIMEAAKKLIEETVGTANIDNIDVKKIRQLRIQIDEARFFFGPSVRQFLSEIDKEADGLLNIKVERKYEHEDNKILPKTAQAYADHLAALSGFYASIPQKFEQEMKISFDNSIT